MEERLNRLLKQALDHHASDIHFVSNDGFFRIVFRVADKLIEVKTEADDQRLLSYLRYQARMDVGTLLRPQTGQFERMIEGARLSLRFAYINNNQKERAVLRILNSNTLQSLRQLSCFNSDIEEIMELFKRRSGLIVISGLTGSGKTTTLYTVLDNIDDKKIMTIEDPIEVFKDNYVQLQVNESIGFDYSEGIKQILRHDPDIIMIGEIRDESAAKAALRAANTGHLVVASIHSSSPSLTIDRLLELDIDMSNLKDILLAVITQRLYRRKGKEDTRCAIYEIVKEKELECWYQNGSFPKQHQSLDEKADLAKKKGYIID